MWKYKTLDTETEAVQCVIPIRKKDFDIFAFLKYDFKFKKKRHFNEAVKYHDL